MKVTIFLYKPGRYIYGEEGEISERDIEVRKNQCGQSFLFWKGYGIDWRGKDGIHTIDAWKETAVSYGDTRFHDNSPTIKVGKDGKIIEIC